MNENNREKLKSVSNQLYNYLKENDSFNVQSRFKDPIDNDDLFDYYLEERNKSYFLNFLSKNVDLNPNTFDFVKEIVIDFRQNRMNVDEDGNKTHKGEDVGLIKKLLLRLCQCVVVFELLRNYDVIDIEDYNQDETNGNKSYYRGHSNDSWDLIPTMLRGLSENAIINKDYLIKRYKVQDLLDKYKQRIGNYSETTDDNIYELTTFMQHSTSYSPLIDLTSEFYVAKSFALSNPQLVNEFSTNDSEIIKLVLSKEAKIVTDIDEANNILRNNLKILYLNKKSIRFGSSAKIKSKPVAFKTFDEIFEILRPDFVIIDCKTNDRMKYQKGAFILFYNYLCFDDKIFYEFNHNFNIKAIKIKKERKRKELNDIYINKRHFDSNHLMDPYLYFKE